MMVFFGSNLQVANNLGLITALHKSPYYRLRTFSMLLGLLLIIFHTVAYYFENIENFNKSTSVIGAIMYCVTSVTKILYFLHRNPDFLKLYLKLKNLCDNKNRCHFKKAQEIEKRIEISYQIITKGFSILLSMALLNPIFLMIYEYLQTGSVVKYRWELVIPFATPFYNIRATPGYEITYVVYAVWVSPMLYFVLAVDTLFMATCYHIHGLFGQLKERIRIFNGNSNRIDYFKSCVEYQNSVYDIVKVTQRVFGGIFFTQLAGAIIILCTQAYLITQNIAGVITYTVVGLLTLAQILVYTYFGTMITTSHEDLIEDIMDVDWPSWYPNERRLLVVVLHRYQKGCRISFLNWINCHHQALRLLLTSVFNLFALLQNIKQETDR